MKNFVLILLLALSPVFQPTAMAATTDTSCPYDFLNQHKDFMGDIILIAYWTDDNGKEITRITVNGYCTIHFSGDDANVVVNIPKGPYKNYYNVILPADGVYMILTQAVESAAGEGSHGVVVFGTNYIK